MHAPEAAADGENATEAAVAPLSSADAPPPTSTLVDKGPGAVPTSSPIVVHRRGSANKGSGSKSPSTRTGNRRQSMFGGPRRD